MDTLLETIEYRGTQIEIHYDEFMDNPFDN